MRKLPPTPHALALSMERDERNSTGAMARRHAVFIAGLAMLILATAAAIGGSFGHHALGGASVVASAMTN